MTALQGAVESTAPVSRLHLHSSFSLEDLPVPTAGPRPAGGRVGQAAALSGWG